MGSAIDWQFDIEKRMGISKHMYKGEQCADAKKIEQIPMVIKIASLFEDN